MVRDRKDDKLRPKQDDKSKGDSKSKDNKPGGKDVTGGRDTKPDAKKPDAKNSKNLKKSNTSGNADSAPSNTENDVEFVATEKMLDKARKDRKEDMKTRNPDLIKQPSDAF